MTELSKSSCPSSATRDTEDFPQLAAQMSKFKLRSFETTGKHETVLKDYGRAPDVVLLGGSMIERMTTTGHAQMLGLWPSEQMWTRSEQETSLERLSAVFNAGCGGDKFENILFRLIGQEGTATDQACSGLLRSLTGHTNKVRTWVVHAGTNDLHKKKGLTDASILAMRVLLMLLIENSAPESHVLVTALFYRQDIANELVDQANVKIKGLVKETIAIPRMHFLPMPEDFDQKIHLEDHVHLNLEGYRIWTENLLPHIASVHSTSTDATA